MDVVPNPPNKLAGPLTLASEAAERESIAQLEKKLGIPEGLFYRLQGEDDWSFLIKTQALLETALAHLIKTALGREEILEFLERLNLQGKTGKLELASALGLITKEHKTFLELMAKFRNDVAHKIQFVSFDLKVHLQDASDEELKNFSLKAFALPLSSPLKMTPKLKAQVLKDPKGLLWVGAMDFLMVVYNHDQQAELARLRQSFYQSYSANHNLGLFGGQYPLSMAGGLLGPAGYTPEPPNK